jgi:hypothetical protein
MTEDMALVIAAGTSSILEFVPFQDACKKTVGLSSIGVEAWMKESVKEGYSKKLYLKTIGQGDVLSEACSTMVCKGCLL